MNWLTKLLLRRRIVAPLRVYSLVELVRFWNDGLVRLVQGILVPVVAGGASAPAFASTVHNAAGSISTANTNRDGTGTIATIFTAGSSGSKIDEIDIKADGNPADCTVVFYLYDGSAYHVFDEWDIGDPAAGSATVASYREARTYENLLLQSGWSLRASITVAPTSGLIQVHAFGGDF
jgi:hypothetical protein